MFSAFKKLTGRNNETSNGVQSQPPPGLTTMSSSLQKKFAKGVHYNMKIILKGDRNVGKTQLFRRIQGQPFVEEYTATEEIQVANITWNYKTSDDIVKVEIWDIVDVANKKRLPSDKLKLENSQQENGGENAPQLALDANTIDVYKNTNGVILVFDITKPWTFDYVKREIDLVPDHIPILIMGNRRDMGHHRAVASDTVTYFIEGLERTSTEEIRYTESSMRNGFGLKCIHKFFNLPYLHLQKKALLKQLDVNRHETEITIQELEFYADSDDANYDLFIDGLSQKRRQVADALGPPKMSLAEAQVVASAKALKDGTAADAAAVAARLAVQSDPTNPHPIDGKGASPGSKAIHAKSQDIANKSELNQVPKLQNNVQTRTNITSNRNGVEDFVPEDDIQKISSFLDDGLGPTLENKNNGLHFEDTSDDDGDIHSNPMVAALVEDVEETDLKIVTAVNATTFQTPLSNSASEQEDASEDDNKVIPKSLSSKIGFDVFLNTTAAEDASSGDGKEKKGKKSHKKSKHHKKKKHHVTDLEDFLSGGGGDAGGQNVSVDTSAYEAL